MIRLPHKPRYYISVKIKDASFFYNIANKVLFKRYGGENKYRDGRHGHFAAKKAGIVHKSAFRSSGYAGLSMFWCPLDYGKEMEECVRKALDIYCEHKEDKPYVITEIKGHRKGK